MQEVKKIAKERMQGFCRVCPQCNGKACVGEVPGMGGLGTGASFMANFNALAAYRLNMRLIHDVTEPDTSLSLFGFDMSLPVFAAPIGGVTFNMGGKITEEEYATSVISGCRAKGSLGCSGDGVPEFIYKSGFAAIKAENGAGIPFIKPWEDKELFAKLDEAVENGCKVIGMDIDAAGLVTLAKMGRPVTPKRPKKLGEIIRRTEGVQFIIKGIMTPDDAQRAVDAGAAGIVVSNHGGRVLDHTPGVAEILPWVAEAVRDQVIILADGGVRTGADVLKLLALGADAAMIGRPFAVAALGGLKEGVMAYIDQLKSQLVSAMVLTGTADVKTVKRTILLGHTAQYR
ncbi:MAG: alpha-hydroxy-acid oxidizing protein [Desulfovibrionaceae bacterium]